jgi:hypothetical protein
MERKPENNDLIGLFMAIAVFSYTFLPIGAGIFLK